MDSPEGMSERRQEIRRAVTAPVLQIDLAAKLRELREQPGFQSSDHAAMTLVKEPDFRIVLIALKQGGLLKEHRADARLSIQALEGRVRLRLPDQPRELSPGQLVVLEPNVPHELEALQPSACLLTIAWSDGRPPA
ncbi:MAG TPA: cupin domain-containing protein [Candidatus Limnocylindrales bacterium]|nr:cupin domain-containing protein [Candidatus Limnocylindrales bacterium]